MFYTSVFNKLCQQEYTFIFLICTGILERVVFFLIKRHKDVNIMFHLRTKIINVSFLPGTRWDVFSDGMLDKRVLFVNQVLYDWIVILGKTLNDNYISQWKPAIVHRGWAFLVLTLDHYTRQLTARVETNTVWGEYRYIMLDWGYIWMYPAVKGRGLNVASIHLYSGIKSNECFRLYLYLPS